MQLKRVVVTGMGAVSPYGIGVEALWEGASSGQSALRALPGLEEVGGLRPRVGGIVPDLDAKQIPRQQRRSMSPMSIFALFATQQALKDADAEVDSFEAARLGLTLGSTTGGPTALEEFFRSYFAEGGITSIRSTHFFKVMNHSAASNVAQALRITGRVAAPSAACATAVHALIQGYEAIAGGWQDAMLCGGTEEFHPLTVSTFDIMEAASHHFNDRPDAASRPFDADRDGVVCSEGCGMLLLESLDSARDRGARILGEIVGTGMNTDPSSVANPDYGSIRTCMALALDSAGLGPGDIDLVNAHATSTPAGDRAEAAAIRELFGSRTPVVSYKGYLGHTLAASGALETILGIRGAREGKLLPNCNLDRVDDECAGINLPVTSGELSVRHFIKNSFGLGGMNASLVLRSYE
ncbi:beta-ketoacyl-[acyl-carrier-protein] synthase family protein [Paucidesulfovibrio longus]|uniref:beta-ketoacyl-[acyl-carrier-protein] synthase family protein n=1 Tax=Paucidesulfovibrio longus TaxID=889 RepID=UPI0003B5B14D|nr:beta-ketoacyl-[acyl-carrier-protein] synthase family protein [Paucidesulfovibrio longus]